MAASISSASTSARSAVSPPCRWDTCGSAKESGGDRAKAKAILDQRLASVPWLAEMGGRTIWCVGGSWRALARFFIEQTHHPLHVVENFTIGFSNT